MSMKQSTVLGEAPSLTVQPKSETIERNTKNVPAGPYNKTLMLKWANGYNSELQAFVSLFTQTFLQFTVLDEDILCQLVSFFKDLLHVDVGHR